MASFTYTWNETTPVGTDAANQLDTYTRDDIKKAIGERLELEHYALDSTDTGADDDASSNAQGRHIPGKVGVVKHATAAQIDAVTGMGTGAMAYATDEKLLLSYTGSAWKSAGTQGSLLFDTDLEDQAINGSLGDPDAVSAYDQTFDLTYAATLLVGFSGWVQQKNTVLTLIAAILSGGDANTYDTQTLQIWVNSAKAAGFFANTISLNGGVNASMVVAKPLTAGSHTASIRVNNASKGATWVTGRFWGILL